MVIISGRNLLYEILLEAWTRSRYYTHWIPKVERRHLLMLRRERTAGSLYHDYRPSPSESLGLELQQFTKRPLLITSLWQRHDLVVALDQQYAGAQIDLEAAFCRA